MIFQFKVDDKLIHNFPPPCQLISLYTALCERARKSNKEQEQIILSVISKLTCKYYLILCFLFKIQLKFDYNNRSYFESQYFLCFYFYYILHSKFKIKK